jgi:hypothetical protein
MRTAVDQLLQNAPLLVGKKLGFLPYRLSVYNVARLLFSRSS